ncbi:MAG TPA: hypothetical protein VEU47_18540 [Candidatus Cybelea sp.]|nr:hypothetical protein [Candidatus Cybelea sp.]
MNALQFLAIGGGMVVTVVGPTMILCWQLFGYLQSNTWPNFSVQMLLSLFGIEAHWDFASVTYRGLSDISDALNWLAGLPASGTILLLGIVALHFATRMHLR